MDRVTAVLSIKRGGVEPTGSERRGGIARSGMSA